MNKPQRDLFVFGLAIGLAVGLILGAGLKALEYRKPHRAETRLIGARIDLEKMVQTNWTEVER